MSNGFYKLNSVVLGFDIKNDINKIRFNHYIMRKENIQRLQGTLPMGQFYMTVRRTATDLHLSISTISRLVREFLDLGIIKLVSKGVKGKSHSIYSYISIEFDGNLSEGSDIDGNVNGDFVDSNIEFDCDVRCDEFNDDFNSGVNVGLEYNNNKELSNDTGNTEYSHNNLHNKDTIINKSISNINTIKNYINEHSNIKKLKGKNSNPLSESINLDLNDTYNDTCKRIGNTTENNQNKNVIKSSNSKVLSDIGMMSKNNSFNNTHDIQKETKSVTNKKESLNKFNKKNIQQSIINMLNKKSGKNFKFNSPTSIKLINERLKEGYVLEDFYRVIEVKVAKWKNTIMEMYIRPETLFSYKFESYVNENISIKSQNNIYQCKEGSNHDNCNYGHSNYTTYDNSSRERKKHENVRYWNPICEI
ncbi:conserved phage C-terminal domain-containing protein [Clostridioides difficile]|nr:conserved phage C-terminal domain-containing protein [Clostridioides difficile]